MSPGWGVSSPPALHERGAGSCPPPGHEPVPAAPGTVAGTPGRLPRPPAHTHPRALARGGPFRLPGPPGAPPPLPRPPPIPSRSSAPRRPLTSASRVRGPPAAPPQQLGELERQGRQEAPGVAAPLRREGGADPEADRQTDRQGEGPRLPPGAAPAGRWRAAPCQAVIADRLI